MTSDMFDGGTGDYTKTTYPVTITKHRCRLKTKVIVISSIVSAIVIVGLFGWIYLSSNSQFDSVNDNIDKDIASLSEDIKDSELTIQESISGLRDRLVEIIGEFDTETLAVSSNSATNVILKLKEIDKSTNDLYGYTDEKINKIIVSENLEDITLTTIDSKLDTSISDLDTKLDNIVKDGDISLTTLDTSLNAIRANIEAGRTIPELIEYKTDEIIGSLTTLESNLITGIRGGQSVTLTSLDTKLNTQVIQGITDLGNNVNYGINDIKTNLTNELKTKIIGSDIPITLTTLNNDLFDLDKSLTELIGKPSGGDVDATGIHANIENTVKELDKSIDDKLNDQLTNIYNAMGIVSGTRLYDELEKLIEEKTDTTELKAMLGTNDSSGLRGDIKDAMNKIISGEHDSISLKSLNAKLDGNVIQGITDLSNDVEEGINDIKTNLINEFKTNIIGSDIPITLTTLNNDLFDLDKSLTELIGVPSDLSNQVQASGIHRNIEYTAKQLDDKLSNQLTTINNKIGVLEDENLYTKLGTLIEKEPITTNLQTFITTELETEIKGNGDITLTSLDTKLNKDVIGNITDLETKIRGTAADITLTKLNKTISDSVIDITDEIKGDDKDITLAKLNETISDLGNTIIGTNKDITLTKLNKNIIGDDTISLTSLNTQLTRIEDTIGSLLNENTNIARTYTNTISLMTSITDGSIDTSLSKDVVSVFKEITDTTDATITVKYHLLCIDDRCIIMESSTTVLTENGEIKTITCVSRDCTVDSESEPCKLDSTDNIIKCNGIKLKSKTIGLNTNDKVIIRTSAETIISTYIGKMINLPYGTIIPDSINYYTYVLPLAAVQKKVYDDVYDALKPQ